MAVLLPGKFVHLGTPRAGSAATHAALKTLPGVKVFHQHMDLAEMVRYQHGPYRGEFAFAAVRNPYDLLVTWWMRTRRRPGDTFLEFVRHHRDKDLERDGRLFFLCVEGVEVMRYESLQEDFDRVMRRLDLDPLPLERVNVTVGKRPWRTYYGPEELAALNDRFGHEVNRYGYDRLR